MRTYNATATKTFFCAYRCAYCQEINVRKAKFSAASNGNLNKSAAGSMAQLNLMQKLPEFYDKVNTQHYTAKLHVDTTCEKCGKKQEWGENKGLWKGILGVLFIALVYLLFRFVLIKDGDPFGVFLISVFAGLCFFPLSGFIVETLYAKSCKIKLDANPDPTCCPYVGDIISINSGGLLNSDDPRIKAILAAQVKEYSAKQVNNLEESYKSRQGKEEVSTVTEFWDCPCGQKNPVNRGTCSKCGAAKPRRGSK